MRAEHMLAEQERHALIAQASRARQVAAEFILTYSGHSQVVTQVAEFMDAANRRMMTGLRANKPEPTRVTDFVNHNISAVGKSHEGFDAAGSQS